MVAVDTTRSTSSLVDFFVPHEDLNVYVMSSSNYCSSCYCSSLGLQAATVIVVAAELNQELEPGSSPWPMAGSNFTLNGQPISTTIAKGAVCRFGMLSSTTVTRW